MVAASTESNDLGHYGALLKKIALSSTYCPTSPSIRTLGKTDRERGLDTLQFTGPSAAGLGEFFAGIGRPAVRRPRNRSTVRSNACGGTVHGFDLPSRHGCVPFAPIPGGELYFETATQSALAARGALAGRLASGPRRSRGSRRTSRQSRTIIGALIAAAATRLSIPSSRWPTTRWP
jgi:hypothetical protein